VESRAKSQLVVSSPNTALGLALRNSVMDAPYHDRSDEARIAVTAFGLSTARKLKIPFEID